MNRRIVRVVLWCVVHVALASAAAAAERVVLVPGVARLAGANGTAWRTDGTLRNSTAVGQEVLLELLPRDSASVAASMTIAMDVGETRQLTNIYELLHVAGGAGMLRITGDVDAWIRTYNQGAAGTFGQDLVAVEPGGGFAAHEVVVFPYSRPANPQQNFRSNLLLVNPGAAPITVTLRTPAGTAKTVPVPPRVYTQVDNLGAFLGAPNGFGAVWVSSDGPWFGVVSTVDPYTGDPTTVRGLAPSAAGERLFAGVARQAGVNQTAWRSEAVLFNSTDAPAQATLELIPRASNAVVASKSLTIAAGETRRVADVYDLLGVESGAGLLRVRGEVLAWVRTFNKGATGSFGQDLPPVAAATGATSPFTAVAMPFFATANVQTGFRSNLVLLNLESRPIDVSLRYGSLTKHSTVAAGSYAQIDNLGAFLGAAPGVATAWVLSDGRWAGTVSTIDPHTGDPTTVRGSDRWRPASSDELIAQALEDGAIDAEQALVYRVFAAFGDSRLPAALRGDDRGVVEPDGIEEAFAGFASLSPATQDLIGPYLAQPFYAGSWWEMRAKGGSKATAFPKLACRPWESLCQILGDWDSVNGTHARIWFESDRAATDRTMAEDLSLHVDATIWAKLQAVMGRVPLEDGDEGGGPQIDVVLTDGLGEALGTTMPTGVFSCRKTPAFILLSRSIADPRVRRSALAHELMHAVQFSYQSQSCVSSYKWLMEATATWFEDHVYPEVDREHELASSYLDSPELAVDDAGDKRRKYGSYLYFFYLTRVRGTSPTVIRDVWEATTGADELHALEAGVKKAGAELEKSWPAFAVASWNTDAPFNRYQVVDRLKDKAAVDSTVAVSVPAGDGYVELDAKSDLTLPHLSARYYQFDFSDSSASMVSFFNGLTRSLDFKNLPDYGDALSARPLAGGSAKGGHVDALLKIGGKWTHEDWSNVPARWFCRDLAAERLESLIVILSNAAVDGASQVYPRGRLSPLVSVSNIGCGAWEGDASLEYRYGDAVIERMSVTSIQSGPTIDGMYDADTPLFRVLSPTAGGFAWSATGRDGDCSYSGSLSGSIGSPMSAFHLLPWVVRGVGHRGMVLGLFWEWLAARFVLSESCPNSTQMLPWSAGEIYLAAIPESTWARVSADGKSITINASKIPDHPGLTGHWTLHAKREP